MDDNNTLAFYNIQKESTVWLTGWSYFKPEDDIYPIPLGSNFHPSKKVLGSERLRYLIIYLYNNRTKELLDEIDISTVKNYWENGIIEILCMVNPGTNRSYFGNKKSI